MRFEGLGDIFEFAGGSFYKYVKGDGIYKLIENIYVSNGMTWNETKNKFYYIDSGKFDVREFDYDPKTGDICMSFQIKLTLFHFVVYANFDFCV